jgi:hypothetical protein
VTSVPLASFAVGLRDRSCDTPILRIVGRFFPFHPGIFCGAGPLVEIAGE